MLFLGISRIQNGFLFVLKIETDTYKAAFRSLNMVGDTKKVSKLMGALVNGMPISSAWNLRAQALQHEYNDFFYTVVNGR